MKRASISIPSHIAEGSRKGTRKDYRHFILHAYGFASELETHVEISKRLNFQGDYSQVDQLSGEGLKMLNKTSRELL